MSGDVAPVRPGSAAGHAAQRHLRARRAHRARAAWARSIAATHPDRRLRRHQGAAPDYRRRPRSRWRCSGKEASALHHLHHEAIVRYFVFTVDPALQRPYLAMEFVDGASLSDAAEERGPLGHDAAGCCMQARRLGPAGRARARRRASRHLARQHHPAAAATSARPRIIDFGIARSRAVGGDTLIGGGFAGKYDYVSPEQLGLFGGEVTPRSDIYSLGLVLAQSLRGRPSTWAARQADVSRSAAACPTSPMSTRESGR